MAAAAGMGIGQLLREGMAKLKADMGSAREKTEEGLLVCPTHDDVAVLAVMGSGHGVSAQVTHGPELHDAIADAIGHDLNLSQHVLNFFPQATDQERRARKAAINAITDFSVRMAKHARSESTNACHELTSTLNSYIHDIQHDIDKMKEIEESITSSMADISSDPLSTDLYHLHRMQCKMKFDRDTSYVSTKHKSKAKTEERRHKADTLRESIQSQMDEYPHSRTLRSDLETCEKDIQRFERELKRLDSDIIKHFSSCMATSTIHAPSESINLSIPLNPSSDKGVTLIKGTISYAKTHIKDYAVIIPYLERIADDCDDHTGLHYEPPTIHNDYKSVDPVIRESYTQQSLMLYNKFVEVFSKNLGVINSTQSRFPVGKDPIDSTDHRIAYPNDGVYLFYALICRHKPANSSHVGKLTDMVNKSFEFFDGRNDYARIATAIKLKLVECNNSHIKLSWAYSGRKILDRIHSDPLYSGLYDRYLRGGDRPEDCAAKLDELLTEIARIAQGRKNVNEPRMKAHDAHAMEAHDVHDMHAYDVHEAEYEAWHDEDADAHSMHAMNATEYAVQEILEAGDEDGSEHMEAMWGHARGRSDFRGSPYRGGRGSSQPRMYSPSAGKGASRVFGKGKGRGKSMPPYHRAYAADAAEPPKGSCHAKGCRASGLRNGKTLCPRCLGVGKRQGKLMFYDGREQLFRKDPNPQAHLANDTPDITYYDDDEPQYDDVTDDHHDDDDDGLYGDTLEAHMAEAARRFNSHRKRPRSQPPQSQGGRTRPEQGHRAYLEQQLQQATQGGRGAAVRDHSQR